ncbi:hypothetical protein ACOSQ3_000976 [Xanthoceras sorbifolium]
MAGWSMLTDGSVVACAKRASEHKILEANRFWVDLEPPPKDSEPESEVFRCWFEKFLQLFLKEICVRESFWPLPPMLGNGRPVDLFKLFLVVREKGGYKKVSKNGWWDLVAKESGLESCLSSSVKLVYFKYLDVLERWLERVVDDRRNTKSKSSDSSSSLSEYLMELGAEFKGVLSNSKGKDKYLHLEESNCQLNSEGDLDVCRNDVSMVIEFEEGEKCVDDEESIQFDSTNGHVDYSDIANLCNDVEIRSSVVELEGDKYCFDDVTKGVVNSSDYGKVCDNNEVKSVVIVDSDGRKKCTDSDKESVVISESNVGKNETSSRKRKHDSMWKMLSWVNGIAKDPCDSLVGSLPEKSKWKSYGNDELWKQVLSYREAVFLKRHVDLNADQSSWQNNQKMHPSMYDDHIGASYNLRERLSCSKKLFSGDTSTQARAYPRSLSFSAQNDSDKRGMKNHEENGLLQSTDATNTDSVFDYEVQKRVPIGPAFQAEVPEWIGVPSESDSKWLGIQVWPLEKVEHQILIERDRIGKGRQDSCGCQFRGSFECVRFHIAEKRYKIKLELGSAFHNWKFDKMGEETMLSWTEEEQKNFETIVRLNSTSVDRCLWDVIFKCFPTKSREELVSYYFNVYLLRRRAHQNRFTPDDIDSDDDEELESGLVSKGFMHETMESASSIFHSPNKKHKKSR